MASEENKENCKSWGKNKTLTDFFKVKKCLFNANPEFKSPFKIDSKYLPGTYTCLLSNKPPASPDSPIICDDGSPFSLFSARKGRTEVKSSLKFCWNTPIKSFEFKRDSLNKTKNTSVETPSSDSPVKLAVQKSVQDPDLIGDYSKPYLFPTIEGKHPDLKAISPDTVASMLEKIEELNILIVDCRYPYEYNGGHIKNALNIFYQDEAELKFLNPIVSSISGSETILVFYCEYSAERAPNMMRFLRSLDRERNSHCYPQLYYPEMYLIEGGYKAFYGKFKDLCEPQGYQPMHDKEYSDEMAFYRNQCKNRRIKHKSRSQSVEMRT